MKSERVPRPSLVGHYAGPVTRLTAFAIDSAVSSIALAVIVSAASAVIELVARRAIDPANAPPAVGSILVLSWLFLYYYVSWSATGKTVGMAMLGLRVVRRDGTGLDHRHALLRTLAFPFSFVFFGLGFVGIVIGREHRAFHDIVGKTTVVYDWDARAAKLKMLAAEPDTRPTPDAA
ncbi:MAG TPA: RDD family protein [Acidimicrobiales bacterium]|nr:RDD family protein [Acidimicrobiales bacterium]